MFILFLFHLLSEAKFVPSNRADGCIFDLPTREASSFLAPGTRAEHQNHNKYWPFEAP